MTIPATAPLEMLLSPEGLPVLVDVEIFVGMAKSSALQLI